MSVVNMELAGVSSVGPNAGVVFHNTITMTAGTYSDTYQLPLGNVSAIGVSLTGDGALEFSFDSPATLSTGSPNFYAWDGVSSINLGVTAFRVKRTTGTVVAQVTVRAKAA